MKKNKPDSLLAIFQNENFTRNRNLYPYKIVKEVISHKMLPGCECNSVLEAVR